MEDNKLIYCIGVNEKTSLFHGLVYRNHQTPSGCDRLLLQLSSNEGYKTREEALQKLSVDFPEALDQIDIEELKKEDEKDDISKLKISKGSVISYIKEKISNKSFFEIKSPNQPPTESKKLKITNRKFNILKSRGIIELDSYVENDPTLFYDYYHFNVVKEVF